MRNIYYVYSFVIEITILRPLIQLNLMKPLSKEMYFLIICYLFIELISSVYRYSRAFL